MSFIRWIKRRFTHNEEDNVSPDTVSTSSAEEYFDVDEDDLTSWEGVEEVQFGEYDEDWTDVENSQIEMSESVEEHHAREGKNTAVTKEPMVTPLSRSRSSSNTSITNSTVINPQAHTHHHPSSCGSCHSCLIGKYKINPFTEIQIMGADSTGHTDIIRQILPLSDEEDRDAFYRRNTPFLIASSCDDGGIIVWDVHSGRKQFTLTGHRLRITCMVKINTNNKRLLVSGSCDKTIKIWDLEEKKSITTLTEHKGSVRCITVVENDKFCSGGNDPELCVWDNEGNLLGLIAREEDENLNEMIALDDHRICTASEKENLRVYDIDKYSILAILEGHKESVQCLTNVNEFMFASASTDGVIILWDTTTLEAKRKLNEFVPLLIPTQDQKPTQPIRRVPSLLAKTTMKQEVSITPPTKSTLNRKIFHIIVINDKYLGVAIGRGFKVYDIETGDLLLVQDEAHRANLNKLIPLHRGNVIVTCSDDSEIRIWNTHRQLRRVKTKNINTPTPTTPLSLISPRSAKRNSRKNVDSTFFSTSQTADTSVNSSTNEAIQATLIGEMALHSKAVQDIVPLSYHSFASCGADVMILVWKDARVERRIRSYFAFQHLQSMNKLNMYSPRSKPIQKSNSQQNLVRRVLLADIEQEVNIPEVS
jgi:WD40 repeat protein